MRSSTKTIVLVVSVLLIAVVATGIYLYGTVYLVIETDGHGGSAIWHEDECFIFMGHRVSGKALRRYEALLQTILRTPLVPAERLSDDLAVFHIKGERLERYVIEDFGSGGGPFPNQGRMYFSRGGDPSDYPYVWEWSGTNFLRVPKSTAEAILDTFPPASGIAHSVTAHIASQGWQEEPNLLFYLGQEKRYPMLLSGRPHVLAAISGVRSNVLVLEGRLSSDSRDVLLSHSMPKYRQVSKYEYQKLKAGKGNSALPN